MALYRSCDGAEDLRVGSTDPRESGTARDGCQAVHVVGQVVVEQAQVVRVHRGDVGVTHEIGDALDRQTGARAGVEVAEVVPAH